MGINELIELIESVLSTGFQETGITTPRIVVALGLSFLIGCFVFFIYRVVVRDGFHSKAFNVVLGAIAPIMAALVLTMQSSLIISLSSIGALSIIRFRTPIKDPMDLLFLFWSIGSGIMCGAGVYEVAIITTFFVAVCVILLSFIPLKKGPYVLVLNASDCQIEDEILESVRKYAKRFHVKSRNLTINGLDMIVELRIKNGKELLQELHGMQAVTSVSLITHDGEIR